MVEADGHPDLARLHCHDDRRNAVAHGSAPENWRTQSGKVSDKGNSMSIVRGSLSVVAALLLAFSIASGAFAVQPDEILDDSGLEERARLISRDLRCLVCQNQSIDDSDAQLARDLRILVRERLVAGDSNREVIDFVVDRYGEFVLLRPQLSIRNLLLWSAPVLILVVGGFLVLRRFRKNATVGAGNSLTEEEQIALAKILGDREDTSR